MNRTICTKKKIYNDATELLLYIIYYTILFLVTTANNIFFSYKEIQMRQKIIKFIQKYIQNIQNVSFLLYR